MGLFKKNIVVMLVCLLMTGIFSTAIKTETVIADGVTYDRDHLPTIVYNYDRSGSRISQALDDSIKYFGPSGSDSHIWFGDISNYNRNNGYHGDAYWRVVDKDSSYNGTSGMMFLTSEFTFTSVQSEQGAMATTYNLLFNDVEKQVITTEGHTPTRTEDFQFRHPTWIAATDKVELSENNKLFSLSIDELQQHFSNEMPTYRGSTSRSNAESADFAARKRQYTIDLRNEAEQYWLRQEGYYYSWDIISGKTMKIQGQGLVANEYSWSDYIVNVNRYSCGTRPSFTLDLSKVLFMSPAKDSDGAKSTTIGLKEVETFERDRKYGEDWKLTILESDSSRKLTVSAEYKDSTKKTVEIHYTSIATVGDSDYITAFITDENDVVKYYGRVLKLNSNNSPKGEFELDLSNVNTSNNDKIYLFSERASGDYLTDYASEPVKLDIELKQDYPIVTFEKGTEQAEGETAPIALKQSEEEITLPACGYVSTVSGMGFLGWKKEGRTTRFLPGEKVTIKADTTFTAEWGKSWSVLQKLIDDAASGSTITLDTDFYAAQGDVWLTIPKGKTITIDLNGHKLDRNAVPSSGVLNVDGTVEDGSVFFVSGENGKNTKLIITDSKGGGIITGGCAQVKDGKAVAGGITIWNGGTVDFNGGTITNNAGDFSGGVAIEGGTFNFNGGIITENNGLMAGGVAVINKAGSSNISTFTMNGGQIISNVNKGFGVGGVSVYGNCVANFTGGTISSNVGVISGGVVVSDYESGKPTIKVSGSPVINNNFSLYSEGGTDVFLNEGILINVDGTLENAEISVSTAKKPSSLDDKIQITNGLVGKGSVSSFISSDPEYIITNVTDEGYLVKPVYIRYSLNEGEEDYIEELTAVSYKGGTVIVPAYSKTGGGKEFDFWTVKSQKSGTEDIKNLRNPDSFTVSADYIATDNNGRPFVHAYANWKDHDHTLELQNANAPTCTANGHEAYWECSECNRMFADEAGTNEISEPTVIPALGHDWDNPTYAWDEDFNVKATRVCKNNTGHTQTEDATVSVEHKKAATCTEPGLDIYTATFTSSYFASQVREVETPSGHRWGEWETIKPATETETGEEQRVCANDNSHIDTRTIPVLKHTHNYATVKAEEPTCTEDGNYEYYICQNKEDMSVIGCGKYFVLDSEQSTPEHPVYKEVNPEDVVRHATGHIWEQNINYVWSPEASADYTEATATVKCMHCDQTKTQTVAVEKTVIKICTLDDTIKYVAPFSQYPFTIQTKTVVAEHTAQDHDWVLSQEDCMAPTCENEGKNVYKCQKDSAHIKKEIIAAIGHNWATPTYEWSSDNSTVTARHVCLNDDSHSEEEVSVTTSSITRMPTTKDYGEITYTAYFSNKGFTAQTKKESINPIGSLVTLTFDAKGGEVNPSTKSVVWKYTYGDLPTPTKNGRSFAAWYTSENFTDASRIDKDTVVAQGSNHTAFARYKYSVYFELADGTVKVFEVYDDLNHMADPGKAPDYQNYIFDYWAKESGKKFDFNNDGFVPGMHLIAVYHNYVSTINNNEWVINGTGNLRFHFVRYDIKGMDEKENLTVDLVEDFEKNDKQIFVDNNLLDEDQYDYGDGSLVVYLKDSSYLNGLSLGTHNLTVKFTDGTVSADFIVKERSRPSTDQYVFPKTGLE